MRVSWRARIVKSCEQVGQHVTQAATTLFEHEQAAALAPVVQQALASLPDAPISEAMTVEATNATPKASEKGGCEELTVNAHDLSGMTRFCSTCRKYLRNVAKPPRCVANGVCLPVCPPELENVTSMEQSLLSLMIPFVRIQILPRWLGALKFAVHHLRAQCTRHTWSTAATTHVAL